MEIPAVVIERMRLIQAELDQYRKQYGISKPDEVVWQDDISPDEAMIVEADGFGKGTLSIVEGNWPVDFNTNYHFDFETEDQACRVAEFLIDALPDNLDKFFRDLPARIAAGDFDTEDES